jgi:hypothetical protein
MTTKVSLKKQIKRFIIIVLATKMTVCFQKYFLYVTLKKVAEDDRLSLNKNDVMKKQQG